MTARDRRPATRLLIAPAVFVVVLIVGLQGLMASGDRPPDPDLLVDPAELPPPASAVVRCERERAVTEPAQREAERLPTGARISSAAAVACPQAFDGRRVVFVGEVVGDVMRRDGGAWVQVNDDAYALEVGPLSAHDDLRGMNSGLQVWLPDDLLDGIEPGRPDRRGAVIEVEGVLLRADPADAGGMTLRADRRRVHAEAAAVEVPVEPAHAVLAAVVCIAAVCLWLLRRHEDR